MNSRFTSRERRVVARMVADNRFQNQSTFWSYTVLPVQDEPDTFLASMWKLGCDKFGFPSETCKEACVRRGVDGSVTFLEGRA